MMKFFRKYTKHLLAIFMSLLLVVWLGGTALTSALSDRGAELETVEGTAFGEEIRVRDFRQAGHFLEILNALGMRDFWSRPWLLMARAINPQSPYPFGLLQHQNRNWGEPLDEREWFMLLHEAQHRGVYVPAEAVEQFKASIPAKAIQAVRDQKNISIEELNRALQMYLQVQEQVQRACNSVQVSEADVRHFVRQTGELLKVRLVEVPARAYRDDAYEPDEEELEEHFETYKNEPRPPGGGLEFGYQLPEAAQVQYIKVSYEPLVDEQEVSDDRAHTYWTENKDEFRQPVEQPETEDDLPRPPQLEEGEPYSTFTEARREVIDKLKREDAKREALNIARNDLIKALRQPWENAPRTQPGNYTVPPDDQTSIGVYPNLVEDLEGDFPGVLSHGITELLDARGFSTHPDLRDVVANRDSQQGRLPLAQAAFLVAGLESSPEDRPEHARFFRNVFETCSEPFTDGEGNVYVMRTIATRPKQPPESYERIRDQLVQDIRLKRAYARAGEQAAALKETATAIGLEQAFVNSADMSRTLGERALRTPAPFARMQSRTSQWNPTPTLVPGMIPGIVGSQSLVEACFENLPGSGDADEPQLLLHEDERQRRWFVVELLDVLPPTEADYQKHHDSAMTYYRQKRQFEVLANWFDPEQIKARIEWKPAFPEEESDEPAEGEKTAAAKQTVNM